MFRKKKQPESSACLPLGMLLRHVIQPEGLTEEQCEAVSWHVARCRYCARLYEAMCDADEELWEEARKATGIPKRELVLTRSPKEAFADLWRRIEMEEAAHRQQRRRTLAFRIGSMAAAACLLIAIGVGWVMMRDSNSSQLTWSIDACSGESLVAFAELVTEQGRKPLDLNQPVTTNDRPQEILLGGMHRVVMNRDTEAVFSVEPQKTEGSYVGRIPYEIQLAQGELYVEVVPGNPFTVKTANARLNITGTKFNVVAASDETTLTLLKGSVQFGNLNNTNQSVAVTAGYGSSVRGQSTPSQPMQVDALAATSWARDFVTRNTLAHAQPGLDEEFLESIRNGWMQTQPPNLDKLDYEQWRDEHREWFKQQFPWIFEIQEFLKEKHGIETDYIDLLMISGDIWQFNYPRPWGKSIPIRTSDTIKHLAEYYNVSLEQFEILTEPGELPLTNPCEIYQNSLTNWQTAIADAVQNQSGLSDELLLFSLHAGHYLTNTRTAAYLWIKQNPQKAKSIFADINYRNLFLPEKVTNKIRSAETFQDYLREQLFLVAEISHNSQELFVTPQSSGCQDNTDTVVRQLRKKISEFLHRELEK